MPRVREQPESVSVQANAKQLSTSLAIRHFIMEMLRFLLYARGQTCAPVDQLCAELQAHLLQLTDTGVKKRLSSYHRRLRKFILSVEALEGSLLQLPIHGDHTCVKLLLGRSAYRPKEVYTIIVHHGLLGEAPAQQQPAPALHPQQAPGGHAAAAGWGGPGALSPQEAAAVADRAAAAARQVLRALVMQTAQLRSWGSPPVPTRVLLLAQQPSHAPIAPGFFPKRELQMDLRRAFQVHIQVNASQRAGAASSGGLPAAPVGRLQRLLGLQPGPPAPPATSDTAGDGSGGEGGEGSIWWQAAACLKGMRIAKQGP